MVMESVIPQVGWRNWYDANLAKPYVTNDTVLTWIFMKSNAIMEATIAPGFFTIPAI